MSRYILSETEYPLSSDYYYEANHTYQDHTPLFHSHSHNYYEIYVFLKGEVQIVLKDHIFNIKKGDVVILPPYYVHNLNPVNVTYEYERQYLWITENCLSSFQFHEYNLLKPLLDTEKMGKFNYHIDNEDDFNIISTSMDKIRASKKHNLYGKEMMNRSYIIQIFTILNSYILKENLDVPSDQTSSLVSQVITYINENFAEDLSLALLCEKFYSNKQSLSQIFKKYTTLTLHNYITLSRISHAKQFICSGVIPSKVHIMCGFNNYTTFYRAFQKIEGITPKEFYDLHLR